MAITIQYQVYTQHPPKEVKAPKGSKYEVEFKADIQKFGVFVLELKEGTLYHTNKEILDAAKALLAKSTYKIPSSMLMVERITPMPRFN